MLTIKLHTEINDSLQLFGQWRSVFTGHFFTGGSISWRWCLLICIRHADWTREDKVPSIIPSPHGGRSISSALSWRNGQTIPGIPTRSDSRTRTDPKEQIGGIADQTIQRKFYQKNAQNEEKSANIWRSADLPQV